VSRLLADHRKGEKAKFAIVEQPTAAATAESVFMMAVVAPPVTAIRQVLGLGETTV
jgi:hypothetical protein